MKPDDFSDRRRFARLNTGHEYGVQATFKGRVLDRTELKNISASGCGMQVQIEEVPNVGIGTIFDRILLLHPDLPYVPLQGTVVWVLGRHAGKASGSVLLGIDFTPITDHVRTLIDTHVATRV